MERGPEWKEGRCPLTPRLFALAVGVCATSACVFWDEGDWSNHVGQPSVFATGIPTPWSIAVDTENAYFTSNVDGGAVYECPVSDCLTPVPLASNLGTPARLAIDADNVYWTNAGAGTVDSCAIGGCGGMPTTIASGQPNAIGIAVAAANVYWVSTAKEGSVSTCPVTGCPPSGPIALANAEPYPFAIAADATGAYWVTTAGDVRFCQTGGCDLHPVTLASNQGTLQYVVVHDGAIYWSSEVDDGSVATCSESGCSPITLAMPEDPAGIGVDETGIYWADKTPSGSIEMCPPGGCGVGGPQVLATAQGEPFGIALDAHFVYFTDSGAGQIMKLPKP
jgi:hypothetical protein